jgi:hypothetical protein
MDIYGVKPEINQRQTLLNYGFVGGYHIFHIKTDKVDAFVQEEMVNGVEDTLTPEIVHGYDEV